MRKHVGPYRWTPTQAPTNGRGFYQSSNGLWPDLAGSTFRLRLEEANNSLPSYYREIDIDGYYTNEWQDDTLQPIMARWPRSRGFLAGWTMGEGMCASLDAMIYDSAKDAAMAAHSIAEIDAEREREYQVQEAQAAADADREAS